MAKENELKQIVPDNNNGDIVRIGAPYTANIGVTGEVGVNQPTAVKAVKINDAHEYVAYDKKGDIVGLAGLA